MVHAEEGEELVVSENLATLWVASDTCKLKKPDAAVASKAKAVKVERAAHQAKFEAVQKVAKAKRGTAQKRRGGSGQG